jgi:hypothetical protein
LWLSSTILSLFKRCVCPQKTSTKIVVFFGVSSHKN